MKGLLRVLRPARVLLSLLVLVAAGYLIAGYYLVPGWVQHRLVPDLGKRLGGIASVAAVAVDPFRLTVGLRDFVLASSEGAAIADFRELSLDVDLRGSLARRRLVFSGRLEEPSLRLRRDADGQFQLRLPSQEGSSGLPFMVTTLEVRGGRLEFQDGLGKPPFGVVAQDIAVTLKDVGPGRQGTFSLVASSDNPHSLSIEGSLGLEPFRSEGRAKISRLAFQPWLERLAPDLPVLVRGGTLTVAADYRWNGDGEPHLLLKAGQIQGGVIELAWRAAAEEPLVTLGELALEGLDLVPDSGVFRLKTGSLKELAREPGRVGKIDVKDVEFDRKGQVVTIGAMALTDGGASGVGQVQVRSGMPTGSELPAGGNGNKWSFARADAAGLRVNLTENQFTLEQLMVEAGESPWLKFAAARAEGLSGNWREPRMELAALELKRVAGADSSVAAIAATGLRYAGEEQPLRVVTMAATDMVTPWLKAGYLDLRTAEWLAREQGFRLDSVVARDLLATGPVEPDSRPPPPVEVKQDASGKPVKARPGAGWVQPSRYVPRAARLPSVEVDDVEGSLRYHRLSIRTMVSRDAEMDLRLKPGPILRVEGLPGIPLGRSTTVHSRSPWLIRIAAVTLANYSLVYRDYTVDPYVRLGFGPVDVRLLDFNTEKNRQFRFRLDAGVGERSKLEVDGQARLDPPQGDLRFGIDQLWLRSLQSYWQHLTGVEVVRGKLNLWGDFTLRAVPKLDIDYSGGAEIVDFESVDQRQRQPFVRWRSLKFDGLVFGSEPRRLGVRTITSVEPFAKVTVNADGQLNLMRDLLPPAAFTRGKGAVPLAARGRGESQRVSAEGSPPRGVEWPIVAGLLRIKDLIMDFTDLRLKPGFTTQIQGLTGTISGLSSDPDATARVLLDGRIDQSAPVRIFGQINPFQFRNHTDVTLAFQGLNLTTLSPYSSRFAGFRIEKGKLDMTLRYRLENGHLGVDNHLILDQLLLGEQVEDSPTSRLPLESAIAILKDSDGRINFELPISGDLSNPDFSLADLYAQAIRQFFVKLVTSPMTLIANLTGEADEDLGYVVFQPGAIELSEAAKGKLRRVASGLMQRPAVHLEVRGVADPEQDKLALAEKALLVMLQSARREELRGKGIRVSRSAPIPLSPEDYQRLFTRYYRSRFPAQEDAENMAPLEGDVLQEAKRDVLATWPVSEVELRTLALQRALAIRDFLVDGEGLPDQRIYLLDVKVEANSEIRAGLSLSAS